MRRIILLFIVLVISVAFTACNSDNQSSAFIDSSSQVNIENEYSKFATSDSFTSHSSSKKIFNKKLYAYKQGDLLETDLKNISFTKVDDFDYNIIIDENVAVFVKEDKSTVYIDNNLKIEKSFDEITVPYGNSYLKETKDGEVLCDLNNNIIVELPTSFRYYGGFIDDEYYYVEFDSENNTYVIKCVDLLLGTIVNSNVINGKDDGFTNYAFDGTDIIVTHSDFVEIYDVKNKQKNVIDFSELDFIDLRIDELIVSYIGRTKSYLYFNVTEPLNKYNLYFRTDLVNNKIEQLSNKTELICDGINIYQVTKDAVVRIDE